MLGAAWLDKLQQLSGRAKTHALFAAARAAKVGDPLGPTPLSYLDGAPDAARVRNEQVMRIERWTALAMKDFKGDGVPQDYAKAAALFKLAADNGDAEAQFQLGEMHTFGPRSRVGCESDEASCRPGPHQSAD